MPINPDAVGATGGPVSRNWTSKDALLYAVGIGAGVDELSFTTENTKDTPQRGIPDLRGHHRRRRARRWAPPAASIRR